ncbi:hypothetical protein F5Y10DRAFT_79838 [Nemania abortiva]|nr:hypothetical protein F5Y10DRAFT_79838 [Nemania abortiva]
MLIFLGRLSRIWTEDFDTMSPGRAGGCSSPERHRASCRTPCLPYQESFSDLRKNKRKLAVGFLIYIWLLALVVVLAFLLLFGVLQSISFGPLDLAACHPDGTFSFLREAYNPWAASGFFQINLAFGSLTYTDVKTIDILWDIVVGRGGQALLSIASWRVFSNYVATSIAVRPVTYTTFHTIFLETGPSIASVYRLARDFLLQSSLDSTPATVFIVWSMLFILGWPTFAGAATGYTPTTNPFILTFDGNYVLFSYFQFKPDAGNLTSTTPHDVYWMFSNQLYSLSYIQENGQCQPVRNRFKWGFSFLQIFILVIGLLVWTFGTCLLWLQSRIRLPFQDQLEIPRGYKGWLLFADTIVRQLKWAGFDARSLMNSQMKTAIRKSLRRGAISLKASFQPATIRSWVAEERPWFIALAVDVTIAIVLASIQGATVARLVMSKELATVAQIIDQFAQVLFTPQGTSLHFICGALLSSSFGLLVAINIGTSTRSRLFLLSCCTVLGLLIVLTIYLSLDGSYVSSLSSRALLLTYL